MSVGNSGVKWGGTTTPISRGGMLKVRTHASGKLDDKGRLSLPSKLRDALGVHRVHSLVLLSVRGAVWGWTPEAFDALEARMHGIDPFTAASQDFAHAVLATAEEVDVDKTGRIRLPAELRAQGGIDREVRVFSVLDRIEIWDERRWQERFEIAQQRAAALDGLPARAASASDEGEA